MDHTRIFMNLKVFKFEYICLLALLCLVSCSRPPLESGHLFGDPAAGRAAWKRMVQLESLKATAILSWKATDGRHGKHKVRLFLEPPERLKIQWLTPWGSVAGQLLMVADQFWFSDSRQRLTWHGQTSDFKALFEQKDNLNWAVATQFFMYWPLLFSSPEEDDRVFVNQASIDYLVTDEGRYLNKVIRFKDGDEMHVRLNDLKTLDDNRLLAHNIEALGHGGQISLTLRQFTLQKELDPDNFIYNLKKFTLRECLTDEGDSYVGERK